MSKKVQSKGMYMRPETSMICVEVESNLMASSVTEYENAGSAGEGDFKDNPFGEFGTNSSNGNTSTDPFDSWGDY